MIFFFPGYHNVNSNLVRLLNKEDVEGLINWFFFLSCHFYIFEFLLLLSLSIFLVHLLCILKLEKMQTECVAPCIAISTILGDTLTCVNLRTCRSTWPVLTLGLVAVHWPVLILELVAVLDLCWPYNSLSLSDLTRRVKLFPSSLLNPWTRLHDRTTVIIASASYPLKGGVNQRTRPICYLLQQSPLLKYLSDRVWPFAFYVHGLQCCDLCPGDVDVQHDTTEHLHFKHTFSCI